MLIKMYKFTFSGYVHVYVHCIFSQSISCRRSLSLFSLWFCMTQQFYQKAWVWVICSNETSNQAKAKNLSNFTLLIVHLFVRFSACSQHQYLLSWLFFFSCVYHLTCRGKEPKKEKRKKEPFFNNRELLSTRKHWTIYHRHYRHIAFIAFRFKISIPFRKLSTKRKYIAFNSFFVLF